ncbi:GNAT family N-acetyltransferase [Streptomyces sp. NPDC059524]|uniref:GNAT family N-acetyltransferase n=1 Tax=Streptomyces sp. NPDC059524 TaxID=3346856 RepID=UPI0036C2C5B9
MVQAQLIRTARLELVPLGVAHAEEMARVLGDPGLHTFIGGEPYGEAELRARYERLVGGAPDPGTAWLNWVVRITEERVLAGTVQATVDLTHRTAEIAWITGTPWQGRGIASEAAKALADALAAGRIAGPIDIVLAHVHPEHHASAAVARAAGLRPTDVHQDGEVRWIRRTAAV